jgi:hypothetical protein
MKKSLPIYSSLHSLSAILALPAVPGSLHFAVYYRAFADRAINRFVAAGRVPGSRPPWRTTWDSTNLNPEAFIFPCVAALQTATRSTVSANAEKPCIFIALGLLPVLIEPLTKNRWAIPYNPLLCFGTLLTAFP